MSIRAQVLADFVADYTRLDESEEGREEDFWKMYTDGASGKNSSGVGVVLISPEGTVLTCSVKLAFEATNNQAEYEAMLAGLRLANGVGVRKLRAFADSQLVVNQIMGEFEVRETPLQLYLLKVKLEIGKLERFEVEHIPREGNQLADCLAKYGNPHATSIKELSRPSIEEQTVCTMQQLDNSWATPIVRYLTQGELPRDRNQNRAIRQKSSRYFIDNNILFRRSYQDEPLRCIMENEVEQILTEVHSGECGNHTVGKNLARKIMRQGYFWPTLEKDSIEYSRKCTACQFHGNIIHQSSQKLKSIISPWPFAMWGMDFVGPFPTASRQRKYLLVLVDYFTKWIEAKAIVSPTSEAVISFLRSEVFSRFGLPQIIVTDNGSQFTSRKFASFIEENEVNLKFASVSHPQSNGQAEAANKSIITALKKKLDEKKGRWADELPNVLWAYRTTPSTSTGETPYSLAFGTEAVTPVEKLFPTARVNNAMIVRPDDTEHWLEDNKSSLKVNLDFLEEKRLNAYRKMSLQKRKAEKYFNKRVKPRTFQKGNLVLLKIEATGQREDRGKLAPNWKGPFIIIEEAGSNAYRLQDHEGRELPRPWNADHLKLFYA